MAKRARNPFKPGTPEAFHWTNGGYSYKPPQTPEQGRKDCAVAMAEAERRGSDMGLSYEWTPDDQTQESFRNLRRGEDPYYLWGCICRDESGKVRASLWGIDFGGAEPWGESYRRVVEAELASEALHELDKASE
jgi:hypothetical protein